MPYVDLNTIHNPATGTVPPASWGDQVRDNLEFLIDPPTVSAFHSVAVSVATATTVALAANSENFDNNAMHSTVTNNSRITIQTAGRYLFFASVGFDTGATGVRQIVFRINGGATFGNLQTAGAGGGTIALSTTGSAVLVVGDYVEVLARHTQGANLDVTLSEFGALFMTR